MTMYGFPTQERGGNVFACLQPVFLVTEAKSTPFDSNKYEVNVLKNVWVQNLACGQTMVMQREQI